MTSTKRVPFLDVQASYRELREELDRAYRRVMESGSYVLGGEVEAFEQEFAEYCGTEHCVAVASGLDALTLSLRALGVGAEDEVIVPGHTYVATWLAASAVGARIVPVDVEATSANLDPRQLACALTEATRAVIPVHLYGQPADTKAIRAVTDKHGIAVLEDAAQAHGAQLSRTRAGSLGQVGAFSFYPSKNLGAFGDGGALTTDDAEIAALAKLHRNYGSRRKYEHELKGLNSRLDPLQAAFLRVKLRHLDSWNERRRAIACRYLAEIEERPAILELPQPVSEADSSWHLFVVRSSHRDELVEHLSGRGIETQIHYPVPPHQTGAYAADGRWPRLPVAERLARTVLSLPIGPHLAADSVTHVIDAVNNFRPAGRRPARNDAASKPAAPAKLQVSVSPRVPRVSCVMGAYRHERYIERALDTLLAQDYPQEAMEIIVVDDGSPDRTPELVKPYLDRIRYIRKPNAGLRDTVNVMLTEATGDYVAFLSADDESVPTSVRRRVELLERRPEVGLCYGDMEVIDADGKLLSDSFFRSHNLKPHRGQVFGELMRRNFVTGGSMMFRAALIPLFHPLPDEVAWEDWWIALKISQVAELDYLDDPVYRYRLHGENMVGGASGAKLARALRTELEFRRYALGTFDTSGLTPDDLLATAGELASTINWVASHDRVPPESVYSVSGPEHAEADRLVSTAIEELEGETERGLRLAVRAFALDPGHPLAGAALTRLQAAHEKMKLAAAGEARSLLAGVREHATLAFAEELTAAPSLLASYAAAIGPADPATLIIYAPDRDPSSLELELLEAIEAAGLDDTSCPDLVAVVTRGGEDIEREIATRAGAVLSERPVTGRFRELPLFPAGQLAPS